MRIERVFMTVLVPLAAGGAVAQTAPQNFAPNSQWEIWSAVGYDTAENSLGTGTVAPIAASANTTGTAGSTTFSVTTTDALTVGQLVKVTGSGVDPPFNIAPMRVTALMTNSSITVRVPLGLTPGVNHAATVTPVVVGNAGSVGTGDAADGWHKTTSMPVWREFYPVNLTANARYAIGAKKDISGAENLEIEFGSPRQVAMWAGKTVVFGIYGYQKVKGGSGTWRIGSNDSVNGIRTCSAVSTASTYQWAECSVTVPLNTTYFNIGVQLDGAANDTYYFENPVLSVGSAIGGVQYYTKPQETLIPVVHISPYTMVNATVTFTTTAMVINGQSYYPFTFDAFADTAGAIAPTVRHGKGQLEGFNTGAPQTNTGYTRIMAWYDRLGSPEHSGSFLAQNSSQTNCTFIGSNPVQTASCTQGAIKSYVYMDMPFDQYDTGLDIVGTSVIATGVAGDIWSNISLEFDEFFLD